MSTYMIDGINLKDVFGLDVKRVSGIEDIPGRKGETFQDWNDSDGIEPFVDADDIILKERVFKIEAYLMSGTVQTGQTLLGMLETILFSPGSRYLTIDYAGSFYGYCKGPISGKRITNAVPGNVVFEASFDFILITPT